MAGSAAGRKFESGSEGSCRTCAVSVEGGQDAIGDAEEEFEKVVEEAVIAGFESARGAAGSGRVDDVQRGADADKRVFGGRGGKFAEQ